MNGKLCGPFGVGQHAVHELQVKLPVDESGAFTIQLMRQAARSNHHHFFTAVPGLDRFTHSLAQRVHTFGMGQRELHRVNADGHDGHRAIAVGPQQFERKGTGVVHQQLLARDNVKCLVYQRINDVP